MRIVFSTLLWMLVASPCSAEPFLGRPIPSANWQGHAVQATPFDLKIMNSGFYEITSQSPQPGQRTIQQIFEQAATFQYKRDSVDDSWQKPSLTAELKRGDCEDMAIWLYRELKQNGYADVRIMVGKFEAKDKAHHTWAVYSSADGDDLIVDPALQRKVWKRSELLPEIYIPAYSFDGQFKYAHSTPQ